MFHTANVFAVVKHIKTFCKEFVDILQSICKQYFTCLSTVVHHLLQSDVTLNITSSLLSYCFTVYKFTSTVHVFQRSILTPNFRILH